jgi:hypothetical protein
MKYRGGRSRGWTVPTCAPGAPRDVHRKMFVHLCRWWKDRDISINSNCIHTKTLSFFSDNRDGEVSGNGVVRVVRGGSFRGPPKVPPWGILQRNPHPGGSLRGVPKRALPGDPPMGFYLPFPHVPPQGYPPGRSRRGIPQVQRRRYMDILKRASWGALGTMVETVRPRDPRDFIVRTQD